MIKISLIIPVFNGEQFIERCLKSCLFQSMNIEHFEIVVVNDGSTDNTLNIIKSYKLYCTNLIFINQENRGVSSARNAGINIARGKYIWFVDADDRIEKNCLTEITNFLEKDDLDVIQINYWIENEKGDKLKHSLKIIETEILSPIDYTNKLHFKGHAWETIYKSSLLKNEDILFNENVKIGEDELFFLSVFNQAKKVRRINSKYYYYYHRTDSALRTFKEEDYYCFIYHLMKLECRSNFNKYFKKNMNNWISTYILHSKKNTREIQEQLKLLQMEPHLNLKYLDRNRAVLILLYKYFGYFGISFHRFFLSIYGRINQIKKTK